ncbi:MAG: hypothetical protein BGO51_18300 [Rhodospirillales bacterium 69-11]|nr:hypothetical protein [Rhodospirillales bacterium]MBN8901743.1 hypothetical protein [Rhodospirillales bacterium]MBN8927119.1 hypothetical protein [Rhodospirillales bacterium]OJW21740.1 MAG: hypothetical protein BGO51_18300 [Rhodospirillales bacterium 69-11]
MHRALIPALLAVALAGSAAAQSTPAPAGQGQAALPHAFLYGAWTGGIFPPPVTLTAQECLAAPTVIFTRDAVLRASPTDVTYQQRLVETVRAVAGGVEFRLSQPLQSPMSGGAFGLGGSVQAPEPGFGCGSPDLLRVQKRGDDQIAFPNCREFPYPLVRCPAR